MQNIYSAYGNDSVSWGNLLTQFYRSFASQIHNLMQGYYMSNDSNNNSLACDSGGHAALVLPEEEASIDRQIDNNH